MRNNFLSKAYGGVTVARRKLNGLGLPRQWKVMTSTLLLLFTFAIGQMWGAPQSVTFGTAVGTKGYVYSSSSVADATLLTDKCVYYSSAKNTVSLSSEKIIAYRLSLIFRLNASANVDAVIGKNKDKNVSYVLYSLTSTQYDFIKGMSGESNDVATAYVALANDHPMKTLFKDAGISANDASRQKLLSAVDVADVTTKLYTSDSYATSTSEVTTIPIWKAATGTNKNVLNAGYYAIYIDCGSSSGNTLDNLTFTAASSCTEAPAAPTGLTAAPTADGATFTITDGANTNNYEIVCTTTSTTPAGDATPTQTGTSKTITVTGLSSGTYYAWVRSVCDATHKSSWFALGAGTFTTLTEPTATFSNSTYDIAGGSALNLASLWTSNSSGAVTYTVEDANGTGAEISTASFTATTAGVAKVKAEQAANGAYSSITKYAYITVGSTADGEHTITWNAKVNTGGSTELQTASKISTSLRLTPANYAVTGLSLTSSNNSTCTDKIANTASEDADKYVSVSFTVADDYQFTPSNFDFKMVAVSKAKAIKVTISDTNGHSQSDTYEQAQNSAPGTNHTYDLSGSAYTGTVTIKIYVWRGEGVTADDGYRIGTPMTITGTVAAVGACTPPTIAWDGDQPENAYVSDGSKTFVMNSNYAAGIAPELSENTCGATIAVKAGTDNKQWVVSFTSAGSVKITPKVVGDGTTVCAETVSGTAKTLTVTQAYDVTFNMNGHGATIAKQVVADGAKAKAPFVADVADWVFGGWFTDAECTAGNEFDFANTTITADRPLYAKWTADACAGDRKSLSKVVLTSATEGTVTGYNGDEYAGAAVIAGLSDGQTAEVDASHEGVETGYKMNGKGSAIVFATLKKGTFQEGDRVVVTITKKNDAYKIEDVAQDVLHIYYGTNASDATKLTTLEGVSAAGSYTYRLTAADVAAIGEKKGIGVFRESSNGQNPYVYSVEITGCRSFAVTHDVNFNMMGYGTAITKQTIEVGAKVTEPAEPEAAGYIFGGWYKENTLVNKWNFSTDVMPDNDITLYAKWSEDPCTDRQSLSKVVLTSASDGTVTGYNGNEYAGEKVIGGLKDDDKTADITGDATKEHGYKLNGGGTGILFATLKKGDFQEGDRVTVGVIYKNTNRVIDESTDILTIYAGSDKDHTLEIATLTGVSDPGFYTYRLKAADITAINAAGYKGIGVFRASDNGENHSIYSVEIQGCRSWAVSHQVTYNMMGHGTQVDPQSVPEGDLLTKPTVVEPEGWAFVGWYKENTLENEWDFTTDVMGTSDMTLYAKWEDETSAIKLIVDGATPGTKKINDEAYYTGSPLTTVEISEVETPCVKLNGGATAATAPYSAGQNDNRVIAYCAQTTQTKIRVTAYSNTNSARPYTISFVEEGQTADQADDNNVIVNLPTDGTIHTTDWYTFNSDKNRTIYITIPGNASNYHFLQVKVIESGTPIKKAGDLGYSMNFNVGRPIGIKQTLHKNFEGFDFYANNDYKVLQSTSMVISNATNDYIKFHAAAPMTLAVTTENAATFYVTKAAKGTGNETLSTAGGISYIDLDEAADWYISPKNGDVKIQKIEFIAPKCEQPTVVDMANIGLCEGDAFTALTVSASVTDGGTLHYQWYKHPAAGDDEAVGTDAATYTPTADGQYYVVVTNQLADHSDNSKTSNMVTVEHFASAVITTAPLNQRGLKDAEVTLSVAATGKNVTYKWYTCDEDGSHEVALDPEQTGTSIEVTITAGLLQWYKVKVTSDCGNVEAMAKVEEFVPATPANVTESIVWDWESSAWPASGQVAFTAQVEDGTDLTPAYELLADADAIVPNNAAFRSDMLYGKGQWVWRSSNKFFQGTAIKFTTEVAGLVRVYYRSTGNNKEVQVTIAGTPAGKNKTSNFQWSEYVEVPAGDVEILCLSTDEEKSLTRVQKIEFFAVGHERTLVVGDLGTVCLPKASIARGVTVYEYKGADEIGKIVFDELGANELLVAGKPYIFQVNETNARFYYNTDPAVGTPDNSTALKGNLGAAITFQPGSTEAEHVYFVKDHAFWMAKNTGVKIGQYRAYLQMNEVTAVTSSPAPGRRRITLGVQGEQVATGLENSELNEAPRKVLINGELFILRGEKMYDAKGQLVK